ncbi:AAA family ATPase [Microbacterium aurum]
MRGGLQRWKRGVASHGVMAAIAYALKGECDATPRLARGVEALAEYSAVRGRTVTRYTADTTGIHSDELTRDELCAWVDGRDPRTGERRGRELTSPQADLLLDGTINAPKSFSIVALVHPDLAAEFEQLQNRLRERIITTWRRELNARRGGGGLVRERLARIEVVELQHRRSRALDPHIHRHLWLNVRVQGEDGKWSNVDSRVAMKLHTVINAEGELAARADPQWIAALSRHGYTIDANGEIAQVAHAVRPLSRRNNQIEANRAVLLARWREAHPGAEPDRDAMRAIDRLAWAKDRPRKPVSLDEDEWESLIREELAAIDPHLLHDAAGAPCPVDVDGLDIPHLAEIALVDADARSVGSGGRFSDFDVRAGAMRAVAASGIVAPRDALQPTIDRILDAALEQVEDLLPDEADRPSHIKGYMASATFHLKQDLAARFDALNEPGADLTLDGVDLVAASVSGSPALDDSQRAAVAAIAGTNRLVAVTGPAGAGKTTLLRVARRALELQKRRMVVVAPTKKAASVAGREIGVTGTSLHALLADHGWRWGTDATGAARSTQLALGDVDESGRRYAGPQRFPLSTGDRIVVDEAGMADLHTAHALAAVARQTGAGIAMIGDPLQAMPVGHSGAMACMARRCGSVVELSSVHRFQEAAYGDLTLRLRDPGSPADALDVARELDSRGCIHPAADQAEARQYMVESYFCAAQSGQRIALITATNDEADAINDAIQQRRLDDGALRANRVAAGASEQRILEGDTVQTRRNDRATGVENRALWTVRRIHDDRIELTSTTDSTDVRTVSAEYAAEHLQLAYASTVHGIQGETTDVSVVGPGVDAAGLYVGMTRGRSHNLAVAIVDWQRDATQAIADTMLRGRPEISVDESRAAARRELARAARDAPPPAVDPRRAELSEIDEWLTRAGRYLGHDAARRATREATVHARNVTDADAGNPDIERVIAQMETAQRRASALRAALVSPRRPAASSAGDPVHIGATVHSRGLGI